VGVTFEGVAPPGTAAVAIAVEEGLARAAARLAGRPEERLHGPSGLGSALADAVGRAAAEAASARIEGA
jgi:hypothetical protein